MTEQELRGQLDQLAAADPKIKAALAASDYPEVRSREPGYTTLLRTIVGQQVSVAAANSVWTKLTAALGEGCPPAALLAADEDALRACGLSRQKQGYARSLAALVSANEIDLHALPADDEEAIADLTKIKGIGRWSAEIYLMFAEGRSDIWPAGDLAVQEGVKRILGLDARPSEKETRLLAERWSPHRTAAALLCWRVYNIKALG